MAKLKTTIGKSEIQGKGLMAAKDLKAGESVGVAHINDWPTKDIGENYNHSDNPNSISKKVGNKRLVLPLRNLKKGEEITVDYRQQPELEQPEGFGKPNIARMMQDGSPSIMDGMSRGRMAIAAELGNPAAKRMLSPNPKTGMTPEGEGTHYMASMGKYAVPLLQDKGGEELEYNENPKPSSEDIKFNTEEEAEYFAEHYKKHVPESSALHGRKMGGPVIFDMLRGFQYGGGIKSPYQLQQEAKTKVGQSNYNIMTDNKPSVAENTKPKNLPIVKQNIVKDSIAEKQQTRSAVSEKIKSNPLLTQEQKVDILMSPQKLDENTQVLNQNPDSMKQIEDYSLNQKLWDIVTNPQVAAEYAISGGGLKNMPHNINQMRMAGIDPGVVPGRNIVGNTLNSSLNLFDAGDKVSRNVSKGNYENALLESMRFIPDAAAIQGFRNVKKIGTFTPVGLDKFDKISFPTPGINKEVRTQANKYFNLATSEKNYERAKALDTEKGTQYVKALDDLKKQSEEFNSNIQKNPPFNIKLEKNPGDGSRGHSRMSIEGKVKKGLGYETSIKDREISINEDAPLSDVKRIISHELKHHYTLGKDPKFYENKYGNELSNSITPVAEISKTNPVLADKLIQPAFTKSDKSLFEYLESPEEIDAYINTNLRDDLVNSNILKDHWDELTDTKVAEYLMGNPAKHSKTYLDIMKGDDFIKNFNKGVYSSAAAAVSGSLLNSNTENKSYQFGGPILKNTFAQASPLSMNMQGLSSKSDEEQAPGFGLTIGKSNIGGNAMKNIGLNATGTVDLNAPYSGEAPSLYGKMDLRTDPKEVSNGVFGQAEGRVGAGVDPNLGFNADFAGGYKLQFANKSLPTYRNEKWKQGAMRAEVGPELGAYYRSKGVDVASGKEGDVNNTKAGLTYGASGKIEVQPFRFPLRLSAEGSMRYNPGAGKTIEGGSDAGKVQGKWQPGIQIGARIPLNAFNKPKNTAIRVPPQKESDWVMNRNPTPTLRDNP